MQKIFHKQEIVYIIIKKIDSYDNLLFLNSQKQICFKYQT